MLAKDSSALSEERRTFLSSNFQINLIVYINLECCNQATLLGGSRNPLYQIAVANQRITFSTVAFSIIILKLNFGSS